MTSVQQISASTTYQPIACELHDYLELACVKRITLSVSLTSGPPVTLTPNDIHTDQDKSEWLCGQGIKSTSVRIRLDQIKVIKAAHENPFFSQVTFVTKK